jgi:cyclic pyranopterin phosphate synthase
MLARIKGIADLTMTTNGSLLEHIAKSLKEAGLSRLNISLDSLDPERYRHITRTGDVRDVIRGIAAAQHAGFKMIKINCVVEKSSAEPDAQTVREFARQKSLSVRFIRKMDLSGGKFWPVDGGTGGNCSVCNRLRLSSVGIIRPCLFNDRGYSVKKMGAKKAILAAVRFKPERGHITRSATFYGLGG